MVDTYSSHSINNIHSIHDSKMKHTKKFRILLSHDMMCPKGIYRQVAVIDSPNDRPSIKHGSVVGDTILLYATIVEEKNTGGFWSAKMEDPDQVLYKTPLDNIWMSLKEFKENYPHHYDFYTSDQLGSYVEERDDVIEIVADIRNKLGPMWNVIQMLDAEDPTKYFDIIVSGAHSAKKCQEFILVSLEKLREYKKIG